jgi:hypothetical protein
MPDALQTITNIAPAGTADLVPAQLYEATRASQEACTHA